jgi:hypothetical protein
MRAKLLAILFAGAVASVGLSMPAVAAVYMCPQPQQINCVPAVMSVGGWQHNGGQTTGNTYSPNSQCSNVVRLGPDSQRLVCCYTKCGVFLRDVRAAMCTKVSESQFDCR